MTSPKQSLDLFLNDAIQHARCQAGGPDRSAQVPEGPGFFCPVRGNRGTCSARWRAALRGLPERPARSVFPVRAQRRNDPLLCKLRHRLVDRIVFGAFRGGLSRASLATTAHAF